MARLLKSLYFSAVLLFLAAPIIVVTGVSLNEPKRLLFPPQGLSLRWYADLFREADWLLAIRNSLVIAGCASVLAVSLALPLALHIWRRPGRLSRLLFGLGVAPFMLPPVISALGFMNFWIAAGQYGSIYATIISHGVFLVSLPLVTISLGLRSVETQLVEAAQTMGADARTTFLTITFPMIRPYLFSGFAFAFVLSLNEYIIAFMISGFTVETLPIKIFNSLRYGYTPVMAAVAVSFVALAVVVFSLVARFGDLPRLLGAERAEN